MPIREVVPYEGRQITIAWLPAPFEPPRNAITQVSGICFTSAGKIVLVAGRQGYWALPGGRPEPNDTLEQTLAREVREEACAVVRRSAYLGAQQVNDPNDPDGPHVYYQARYWARVELRRFRPKLETAQRILVAPPAFVDTLKWASAAIAQALLDAALAVEVRYGSRR